MAYYILRNLKDVENAMAINMRIYSVLGLKYSDLIYRIAATMSVLYVMMRIGVVLMPSEDCVEGAIVNL
jgi:hypothetical protein